MASVGKASLTIVPKFDNLGKTVTSALSGVNGAKAGEKTGEQYASGFGKGTSGLVKSGAVMGVFSAATSRAMDMISSSVSGAVSRLDTLNNYPRVMQALGYSAEASESSIAKMSDHLTGLPTALNDMTSTVQGIAAVTGDIDQATAAGLALNDMLLASGSSTALTSAAMEQFRQMLAKGNPEMQDWKSLTSAMPGQMNQLAQSLLGPAANANDLYEALGGGGAEATISMDALMAKMVELDTTGTESFTSFADQAKNATGGIESSISNMETAIARGMAGVMDSIGSENISGAIKDVGGAFEGALKSVGSVVSNNMPLVIDSYNKLKEIGPTVATAGASFAVFKIAGTHLAGFASKMKAAVNAQSGLAAANKVLGTSFSPVTLGITAAAAVLGVIVTGYLDAKKKSENFEKATTGLSDAVSRATGLKDYSGTVGGVGENAETSAMKLDELTESMGKHVDKINETTKEAETQISQLNTAQQIIGDYSGKTDLSTDAQGRLEWAIKLVNEQFGLSVTAADVAAGAYSDTEGNVVSLKEKIDDLIESKKNEIRLSALTSNLSEAYEGKAEAAASFAAARTEYNKMYDYYLDYYTRVRGLRGDEAKQEASKQADLVSGMSKTKEAYESATDTVNGFESELGDTAKATSEAADAFDEWGNSVSDVFVNTLKQSGTSLAGLKDDLRSLGVDTEELAGLGENELLRLADAYDGTASSAAGALSGLGVAMDEEKAKTAIAADAIRKAISDMGDGVTEALSGVDTSLFSQRLAEAGISTEQLNEIGSENFAQLAESCNGNIDAMVFFIQHYNDTPLVDKDGSVAMDDAALIDAQGRVWTWNGTTLVDKDGNAAVEDVSLTDAQGHLLTWNGSDLVDQNGNALVSGNVPQQIGFREDWNNGDLWDKEARATIDIFRSVTDFFTGGSGNAAGGIRLNAAGGYRYHAAGAIAHKAVPLDIVGEDGAEAIVPLTNKRYSLPFARTLAEQMGVEEQGSSRVSVDDIAKAVSEAVSGMRVYVDGRKLVGAIGWQADVELARIQSRKER